MIEAVIRAALPERPQTVTRARLHAARRQTGVRHVPAVEATA